MVRLRNIAALMVLVAGSASANVTISPTFSTVAENLSIMLEDDSAFVSGEFEFVYSAEFNWFTTAAVQIPVWLPAQAGPGQTNLAALLKIHDFEGIEGGKSDDDIYSALDKTIGLGVKVNGAALECPLIETYGYDSLLRTEHFPVSYWRPGVVEARFYAPIDHDKLSVNTVHLTVQYRQPLIITGGRTLLFYVPFFDKVEVPPNRTASHEYTITVQCPEGYLLVPRTRLAYHAPATPTRLVIAPKDQQVILVELIEEGQENSASALDSGWFSEPPWVEKQGDAACKCKGKSGIHLQSMYWVPVNPLVGIDGELYSVGDKFDDFEIVRITRTNVVFRCPEQKAVVKQMTE